MRLLPHRQLHLSIYVTTAETSLNSRTISQNGYHHNVAIILPSTSSNCRISSPPHTPSHPHLHPVKPRPALAAILNTEGRSLLNTLHGDPQRSRPFRPATSPCRRCHRGSRDVEAAAIAVTATPRVEMRSENRWDVRRKMHRRRWFCAAEWALPSNCVIGRGEGVRLGLSPTPVLPRWVGQI